MNHNFQHAVRVLNERGFNFSHFIETTGRIGVDIGVYKRGSEEIMLVLDPVGSYALYYQIDGVDSIPIMNANTQRDNSPDELAR